MTVARRFNTGIARQHRITSRQRRLITPQVSVVVFDSVLNQELQILLLKRRATVTRRSATMTQVRCSIHYNCGGNLVVVRIYSDATIS